ncbi:type 4a pilus biogenesis protein PilO [Litorivivens sp.]|uniref:type 4a pilus biogenesis protein PilO n=1 Tax=Litorivivens sp. TaxID=2020868 RepID=UPI0035656C66
MRRPDLQAQLNPDTLRWLLMGLLLLLVAASGVYLVKPKVVDLRSLLQQNAGLSQAIAYGPELQAQIEQRYQTMAELETKLFGSAGAVAANQIERHVVGELQKISWQQGVTLKGVKPLASKPIHIFNEIPFEVELRGDYFSLFAWLQAVNQQLGFVVVDQLEITAGNRSASDPNLDMTLRMANYRVAQ